MQPEAATLFRDALLNGEWDSAVAVLPRISSSASALMQARFNILRQKYIELLQEGNAAGALVCLRKELQPAGEGNPWTDSRAIHSLAALLLQPGSALIPPNGGVESTRAARANLLADLQTLLPPSLLIPEGRLEELIEQALIAQLDRSHFHNSGHLVLSLFADYSAGPDQLPSQQVAVLEGHTDEVWAITFSHDGRFLASSGKDGAVILWEVGPGRQLFQKLFVLQSSQPVNVVAFSPDDQYLLTGGADFTIRLFSMPTGHQILEKKMHDMGPTSGGQQRSGGNDAINAASWFPDGQSFLIAMLNKTLLIYSTDGVLKRRIRQPGYIYDALVSRDGSTVVVVAQDKSSRAARLRFVRLTDGKEVAICESSPVMSVSTSTDGKHLLANLSSHVIHLWPLGDLGEPHMPSSAMSPRPGALDPLDALPPTPRVEYRMNGDGQPGRFVIRSSLGGAGCGFVASGSETCIVYMWHRESGELLASLEGHSGTVNSVAWNPKDHYMLASASDDHTIRIWLAAAALKK